MVLSGRWLLGRLLQRLSVVRPRGEGPTQFTLATLAEYHVSSSSAIIIDECGNVSGITLMVTNHLKKEEGLCAEEQTPMGLR
jgi:hypothetical protein